MFKSLGIPSVKEVEVAIFLSKRCFGAQHAHLLTCREAKNVSSIFTTYSEMKISNLVAVEVMVATIMVIMTVTLTRYDSNGHEVLYTLLLCIMYVPLYVSVHENTTEQSLW